MEETLSVVFAKEDKKVVFVKNGISYICTHSYIERIKIGESLSEQLYNKLVKEDFMCKKSITKNVKSWSDINNGKVVEEIFEYYKRANEISGRCVLNTKKRTIIKERLKSFTPEEIKKAIDNRSKDEWINGDGIKFKKDFPAFFRNDEKIEHYLNAEQDDYFNFY
jgi:ribosomal protein S1